MGRRPPASPAECLALRAAGKARESARLGEAQHRAEHRETSVAAPLAALGSVAVLALEWAFTNGHASEQPT